MVIEAGASLPGEIARARTIIEPSIGMITNVAESHLEGFGSVAGVLHEKLELIRGVAVAIVGSEPEALAAEARLVAPRVTTAGLAGTDTAPSALTLHPSGRTSFTIDGVEVHLPLQGQHQAANAMLAWSLVRELGLDSQSAAAALSSLVIPGGRGEILEAGGFTIVHDAYNANPSSFRAAIATARAMRPGRRLVFVAGSMRELGVDSARLHRDIAELLVALEPDLLAVVGEFVPAMEDAAPRLGDRLVKAADPLDLGPRLATRLRGDELIFLKASRGVALERIFPYLGVSIDSPH
jgi:UDP-N-acetylmuramoyl-tripeptide--D-alanyl-D-alanine ligase